MNYQWVIPAKAGIKKYIRTIVSIFLISLWIVSDVEKVEALLPEKVELIGFADPVSEATSSLDRIFAEEQNVVSRMRAAVQLAAVTGSPEAFGAVVEQAQKLREKMKAEKLDDSVDLLDKKVIQPLKGVESTLRILRSKECRLAEKAPALVKEFARQIEFKGDCATLEEIELPGIESLSRQAENLEQIAARMEGGEGVYRAEEIEKKKEADLNLAVEVQKEAYKETREALHRNSQRHVAQFGIPEEIRKGGGTPEQQANRKAFLEETRGDFVRLAALQKDLSHDDSRQALAEAVGGQRVLAFLSPDELPGEEIQPRLVLPNHPQYEERTRSLRNTFGRERSVLPVEGSRRPPALGSLAEFILDPSKTVSSFQATLRLREREERGPTTAPLGDVAIVYLIQEQGIQNPQLERAKTDLSEGRLPPDRATRLRAVLAGAEFLREKRVTPAQAATMIPNYMEQPRPRRLPRLADGTEVTYLAVSEPSISRDELTSRLGRPGERVDLNKIIGRFSDLPQVQEGSGVAREDNAQSAAEYAAIQYTLRANPVWGSFIPFVEFGEGNIPTNESIANALVANFDYTKKALDHLEGLNQRVAAIAKKPRNVEMAKELNDAINEHLREMIVYNPTMLFRLLFKYPELATRMCAIGREVYHDKVIKELQDIGVRTAVTAAQLEGGIAALAVPPLGVGVAVVAGVVGVGYETKRSFELMEDWKRAELYTMAALEEDPFETKAAYDALGGQLVATAMATAALGPDVAVGASAFARRLSRLPADDALRLVQVTGRTAAGETVLTPRLADAFEGALQLARQGSANAQRLLNTPIQAGKFQGRYVWDLSPVERPEYAAELVGDVEGLKDTAMEAHYAQSLSEKVRALRGNPNLSGEQRRILIEKGAVGEKEFFERQILDGDRMVEVLTYATKRGRMSALIRRPPSEKIGVIKDPTDISPRVIRKGKARGVRVEIDKSYKVTLSDRTEFEGTLVGYEKGADEALIFKDSKGEIYSTDSKNIALISERAPQPPAIVEQPAAPPPSQPRVTPVRPEAPPAQPRAAQSTPRQARAEQRAKLGAEKIKKSQTDKLIGENVEKLKKEMEKVVLEEVEEGGAISAEGVVQGKITRFVSFDENGNVLGMSKNIEELRQSKPELIIELEIDPNFRITKPQLKEGSPSSEAMIGARESFQEYDNQILTRPVTPQPPAIVEQPAAPPPSQPRVTPAQPEAPPARIPTGKESRPTPKEVRETEREVWEVGRAKMAETEKLINGNVETLKIKIKELPLGEFVDGKMTVYASFDENGKILSMSSSIDKLRSSETAMIRELQIREKDLYVEAVLPREGKIPRDDLFNVTKSFRKYNRQIELRR